MLESEARKAFASRTDAEKALSQSKDELARMTTEIEKSIPIQARAAFFNAAIPEIDQQILYLSKQREEMVNALKVTGVSPVQSSLLKKILETEINATVMARRRLDEKQIALSIFTGIAAAMAVFDLPPLRIVFAYAILWAAYGLGHQWAAVYPEARLSKFIKSPLYRFLPVLFVVSILALVALVVILVFVVKD